MASFNRVVLVGNMTRDVDLRHLQSGMAVTDIGLAVNHRYKNQQGEWVDEATFVDVTLWGRSAEIASEYTSKGSQILIEGRLKLDTWEKEGQKHSKLKVVGERLVLLGSRGGGGGGGGGRGQSNPSYDESEASGGSYSSEPRGGSPSHAAAPSQGDDIPF
jgi:single-strand DNA-binding protein